MIQSVKYDKGRANNILKIVKDQLTAFAFNYVFDWWKFQLFPMIFKLRCSILTSSDFFGFLTNQDHVICSMWKFGVESYYGLIDMLFKVISEPFQFCSMNSLERKFFKGDDGSHTESKRASHSGPDEVLITFIIHSKYFPDSDWLKALV